MYTPSLLFLSFHCLLYFTAENGVCINWNYNDESLLNEHITGTDIDPISSIVTRHHVTYTSSRDGRVRIYESENIITFK